MSEHPPYSRSALGLARWFFRVLGVAFVAAGVLALVYARSMHWLASMVLLVVGIAAFTLSFHRRDARVTSAARDVIDTDPLP